MSHRIVLLAFLTLWTFLSPLSGHAAVLPPGFVEKQFGGVGADMAFPTAMAFAPDGRLFVCTQGGSVRVIKDGVLLGTPFLAVSVDSPGERGLLGIAFDPGFVGNRFVYIYYTVPTAPVHNRVSRFTANGDVAVPGSEAVILELDNLSLATNHNGGAIHFGPDGRLYVATGENANPPNSQSMTNLLGKILRINSDGSIPTDNPFYLQATGKNRAIWALGLRNPFTFAFQPGTGRMFINDVGEATWEEIDDGRAGANYGWPLCEGNCTTFNPSFADPIYQYYHDGTTCAIVGSALYDPGVQSFPMQYRGKYFFADLCAGYIRVLDPADLSVSGFASGVGNPVDLQVGPDGALYYLQRGDGGQVWRVSFLRPENDFDGDGRADPAVWRGDTAFWYILRSSDGALQSASWGFPSPPNNDVPVPGDYDGDGKTDIAFWRPSSGTWFILPSNSPGTYTTKQWGTSTDKPVPADFDGDGKADFAVWRPSSGVWYITPSSAPSTFTTTQWGVSTDVPVPADYDGDGKVDIAVWRPTSGVWYILPSGSPGTFTATQWGISTDKPAPGDYDGDGKADIAVWRPGSGTWYVLSSSSPGTFAATPWGVSTDIPVAADYDGDGKTDVAVWRPGTGTWYVIKSTNPGTFTSTQWGVSTDTPLSPLTRILGSLP